MLLSISSLPVSSDSLSSDGFGQRLVELGQRALGVALVEVVDGAIIAQAASDDRVRADRFGSAGEQRVGLGEAAEVGLLQRFVDQRFGAAERRFGRAAARRGEEFGRLGIAAGIVAAIGFLERLVGRKRTRLDSGEGGGVADAGGRDRNLALDRLVGDQAAEAELERAVVAGETFGGVIEPALAQLIGAIDDVGVLELAFDHLDRAEAGHAAALCGGAGCAVGAVSGDACRGPGGIVQLVELADRKRGVAAGDRIAGVEHAGERLVGRQALRRAEAGAGVADAPAVADAERRRRQG